MKILNVVIPIYNEEGSIKKLISELKTALNNTGFPYKIIPVNDGSSDKTKALLNSLNIPHTSHTTRKGYGASIKHGIELSEGELICIIDADMTYSPHDITKLLKYVDTCDMVTGARIKYCSEPPPLIYRISKFLVSKLLGFILHQKVPDINSGLRIMKKSIINKYLHILPDGFSFTATITFAMMLDGYKIKYVPIDYYKRQGKSKINKFSYTLNFIRSYYRTLLNKLGKFKALQPF